MDVAKLINELAAENGNADTLGGQMHATMQALYPICRSITGDGVRATLDVLEKSVPLQRHAVPSGTRAFDWTVNDEWNVRDAYVADRHGNRLIDFHEHNLHLVGYSTPVRRTMTLEELRPHLHTLPDRPDWIPYRTTYYNRTWGFCLSHNQLQRLGEGPFEVVVDTRLEPGELTYGELVVPGEFTDEVLFSAHTCHPSLANDNLSGLAVAIELVRALERLDRRRYTYRFIFAPGTIGSITWLSRNADVLPRIRHGLVLTGLGGPGSLVYKRTRRGERLVDRATAHVVLRRGGEVRGYSPYGYDERQFNAIGFDLPVGRLSRTPHGEYPQYHTSADNLDFVTPAQLVDSLGALLEVVDVLENDRAYRNLSPYGEPQLGKRGLYPTVGGRNADDEVMAMLWTLGYSDGDTSLLDISETAGMPFSAVRAAGRKLSDAGLLGDA
ncbi:MAG: DUF4910 domain-containing protein [Nocardioidaceae bacterium]